MMSNSAYSSFEMIFEKTFHLREQTMENISQVGSGKRENLKEKKT